jgi:hypothetical protein
MGGCSRLRMIQRTALPERLIINFISPFTKECSIDVLYKFKTTQIVLFQKWRGLPGVGEWLRDPGSQSSAAREKELSSCSIVFKESLS